MTELNTFPVKAQNILKTLTMINNCYFFLKPLKYFNPENYIKIQFVPILTN